MQLGARCLVKVGSYPLTETEGVGEVLFILMYMLRKTAPRSLRKAFLGCRRLHLKEAEKVFPILSFLTNKKVGQKET